MSTTLAQLESISYAILREEGPTSAYPQVLMDLFLNAAQQDILAGRVIHPYTKEEARAGQLHFLNTDIYYNNVISTYLTADTTIGASTIYATTTDYPTTGALYISGNIVTYTGITSTSFTGCSGVLFPFTSGTKVSIAFALPSDFSDIINVTYNNKFKLPCQQYDDIFENLNSFKGNNYARNNIQSYYDTPYRIQPFYTIKDAQYLIIGQLNNTGESIRVRYQKLAPTMTSVVDATIDNDIYAQLTIPYLAVAEMLANRGEEARAGDLWNIAIAHIRKMYDWYNSTSFEDVNGVHYSMGKGLVNL